MLVSFFRHHTADAIKSFPYFSKSRVERCKAKADVIRFTEVRDKVHLVDERSIYTITFFMPEADVRTAPGGIAWGTERKAERGK